MKFICLRTSDNRWQWVLDRRHLMLNLINTISPLRMSGTLKDISQLKATEEKLRLFQRSIETLTECLLLTLVSISFVPMRRFVNSPIILKQRFTVNTMDKQLNLGFSVNQLLDLKQRKV